MSPVADADDDDVATAVALVTLYGSGAMLVVPALARLLGLDDRTVRLWAGLSVHEVAQAVAAARCLSRGVEGGRGGQSRPRRAARPARGRRPPWMPLFVVGFLVAVAEPPGTLAP